MNMTLLFEVITLSFLLLNIHSLIAQPRNLFMQLLPKKIRRGLGNGQLLTIRHMITMTIVLQRVSPNLQQISKSGV